MHDAYLLVGEDRICLYTNILNLNKKKNLVKPTYTYNIYIHVHKFWAIYIYIICVCVCIPEALSLSLFFCAIKSLCFCGRDILRLRAEAKTTRASAAPSELPCRLSGARLRLLYRKGVRIYAHIYVISILHTLYNMSNIPYIYTSIMFYLYHVNIFSCIL